MQNSGALWKNSFSVSHKVKHIYHTIQQSYLRSFKNLYVNVYNSLIGDCPKLETKPKCSSAGEWLYRLRYIHTTKYYSARKRNVHNNMEESLFIYLFIIYFWLCWVFVSVRGLSLVVASGGHSSSRWAGLSLSRPLLLRSTGSRCAGSVVVAHGPSCSAACGIFPDQGLNPCPCIGRQILNHCATREALTWRNLKCIILNEKCQAFKTMYCVIPFV